jgi:HAD superfamily hydrolase (TIGR01509 family)
MAAIHHAIGMGSDQLLDALLPGSRDKEADPGIRTAHGALYATYWSRLRPLPRAPELLRACRNSGLRVVLASSADPQEFAVLRGVLGAEDAIEEATSAADVHQSKPAPDLVQVALNKAGVAPERAVFVGDTVWDVQACRRAGVPCIGLRSGGISTAELLDAGAAAVFAGPADRRGSPSAAWELTTPPGARGLFLRRQWLRSTLTSCFLFIAERPLSPICFARLSRSCLLQSLYDPPLPPLEAVARRELPADALAILADFSLLSPFSAATR